MLIYILGSLCVFLHVVLMGKMSPLDQNTPPQHTHTACEDNVTAKPGEDQEETLKEQGD